MKNKSLVLYDHQIFSYQSFGGVSRYFIELLKHIDPLLWDISLLFSNNKYLNEINSNIFYIKLFNNLSFYKKERLILEMGKPYSIYKIINNNYKILHLTHYESYANNFTKNPIVITYHDKLFSSYCFNKRTIREQKKCFKRADKIISISNNTRKDLISLFDIDEKKIEVIYFGINKNIIRTVKRIIDEKYILYVGARKGYKNFFRLLEAFTKIIQNDLSELKLVCTGNPFNKDELNKIKKLGIKQSQISSKFYSETELMNLYQNAELFIFPSIYEGFGFPLLEAMINNCPVLCSNSSCFPEIAKNAAEYFSPLEIDDIYFKLRKVLFSDDIRKKLKINGLKRCEDFSWIKSAQKHVELYNSLI